MSNQMLCFCLVLTKQALVQSSQKPAHVSGLRGASSTTLSLLPLVVAWSASQPAHLQVVAIASTVCVGSSFSGLPPRIAFCQGFPLCNTFFVFVFSPLGVIAVGCEKKGRLKCLGTFLWWLTSSQISFRIRSLLAQLPGFGFPSCVSGLQWLEKSSSWVTFWLHFGFCLGPFKIPFPTCCFRCCPGTVRCRCLEEARASCETFTGFIAPQMVCVYFCAAKF